MSSIALSSLWAESWRSHDRIKRYISDFIFFRKNTEAQAEEHKHLSQREQIKEYYSNPASGAGSDMQRGPEVPEDQDSPHRYTPPKLIGLVAGPLLFVLFMFVIEPAGLSPEGRSVLASTLWIAVWWITEAIPIPITSLLPVILLPITGAMEGGDVVSAYGADIIFLFLGGFMLAIAMEKWNLHQRIALTIVKAIGASPRRIILGFMVATGFLSMWVSNTAATMMMIPVGLAVASQAARTLQGSEHEGELPRFERSLVLGVGYSATIGGLGTLIGTPPLAIMAGLAPDLAGTSIGFGQWMMLGVPVVVVLMACTWLYLTGIAYRISFKELPGGRELIGKQLADLGRMTNQEKKVLIVFLFAAFMWVSRDFLWTDLIPGISDGMIAMIAMIALFALPSGKPHEPKIMQWEDSKTVPWGVLILFGGGLAIAAGFTSSGLSEWIGTQMGGLAGLNYIIIVIAAAALVLFLTEITSNTATATMILPVMASFATALGVHPLALMVPCAMAANSAFMLPVGTPPNAIMFGTGKLTIMQMVRAGWWVNLIALVLLILAVVFLLPVVWPIDMTAAI